MGKEHRKRKRVDENRRARPYHGDFGGCEYAKVRVRYSARNRICYAPPRRSLRGRLSHDGTDDVDAATSRAQFGRAFESSGREPRRRLPGRLRDARRRAGDRLGRPFDQLGGTRRRPRPARHRVSRRHVYLAASDEIFVYDQAFRLQGSFRNAYLKHCHEITVDGDRLLATSTGYDSVLEYDLAGDAFTAGHLLRYDTLNEWRRKIAQAGGPIGLFRPTPRLRTYDPMRPGGPTPADTTHVNNVTALGGDILVCGTKLARVVAISSGGALDVCARAVRFTQRPAVPRRRPDEPHAQRPHQLPRPLGTTSCGRGRSSGTRRSQLEHTRCPPTRRGRRSAGDWPSWTTTTSSAGRRRRP